MVLTDDHLTSELENQWINGGNALEDDAKIIENWRIFLKIPYMTALGGLDFTIFNPLKTTHFIHDNAKNIEKSA